MTRSIIVAVGGNALSPDGTSADIATQFRHTRQSLEAVVGLAEKGWRIVIVHGNGPQVGDALVRNELASTAVSPLPLGVLVAATAGWIGYMMQQSLVNALRKAGVKREVVTLITQTEVRANDPAFEKPDKPVGHALSEAFRAALEARGAAVGQDGRGRWRRLAPSPRPLRVIEADAVRQLFEEGKIVIAAGGGGPPVTVEGGMIEGVDAVVDKDCTAALLGPAVGAEVLLILTDVDAVYRNWGSADAEPLSQLTVAEAEELMDSDELGAGSMKPKLEAATLFLREGGKRAVIARLDQGHLALEGKSGTTITGEVS